MKTKKIILMISIFLITGCKEILYSELSEAEANQMQALLLTNNIDVDKTIEKSKAISLSVDKKDFVKSIKILNDNGFPKKKLVSIETIFPASQLISSPMQESAKLNFIKEQSIEKFLNKIPGVVDSSVTLNALKTDGSSGVSTASVLIITAPQANLEPSINQIKGLVKNSVDELSIENITVVIKKLAI
ncbi:MULTISPECIES: type III secretion system inner membrane ring lipoprotein SctJ [Edwardsiella]|uniref:Lipoprotein n=2 Tax=Edwardsiella anguillarum TaxID=1821960 RepID=A0A076LIJ1_9GAMM|nr:MULTISPECIES: type III secretion inner membrane ring lipoprotein SctJ [Edwardsiella]AIJ07826.1 Type III secretion bridge between inner and outermembrane lipoprotein (YscJ,HrcJ,EscJ, PscJ) [Edwardsiella anguillarum ET080813]AKR78936.1 type III secretion inner membrane ring lipoprotein SctJ [Edwardsiella sp. LADL05-105]KAB0588203.1 EscJ/YscJ/HrcJ family type III secretion inner membrane ring protein [Edwardsiella anguillarum]UOU78844.1 type III secretion inner membrane ring lipoprotein SctJ [E